MDDAVCNDGLCGERPEAADDLGTDDRELLLQEWIAGGDFIRFRIAVVRRPALQDVADVDVFAFQIDRLDDLREQAVPHGRRKASPCWSSSKPGASPTNTSSAFGLPEPKTILVRFGASLHRWQSPMSSRMA